MRTGMKASIIPLVLAAVTVAGCRSAPTPETPAWRTQIEAALDSPMTFDFVTTPLDDCVAFFRSRLRVNIVADKEELFDRDDIDVTLKVAKTPFRDALQQICDKLGLVYTIEHGAIFITTQEALATRRPPGTPADGWPRTMLELRHGTSAERRLAAALDQPVSFEFVTEPFVGVIGGICQATRIKCTLDGEAVVSSQGARLTATAKNMKLKSSLEFVCDHFGLDFTVRGAAIYIADRERVADENRVNKRVYEERARTRRRAADALRDPEAERYIAVRLSELVSFDFVVTPLEDVVGFLSGLKKVNMVIDERGMKEREHLDVTLRLKEVRLEDALHWITVLLDLHHVVRDGAIFISTREGIRARDFTTMTRYDRREWRRTKGAMKKRISVRFVGTSLRDVAKAVSDQAGVPVRIGPELPKDHLPDITLRLENVKVASFLAHMCYLHDLAYTVRDGVVIITSRDRLLEPEE